MTNCNNSKVFERDLLQFGRFFHKELKMSIIIKKTESFLELLDKKIEELAEKYF